MSTTTSVADGTTMEYIETFDVVVIGSGVAGAMIASQLAPTCRVLLLEAGEWGDDRLALAGRYAVAVAKTPHSPYKSSLADRLVPSPDGPADYEQVPPSPTHKDAFLSGYERRVGGSTWHWLGHTPRLLPSDFEMHQRYGVGVDWPISYELLEPWYTKAERELGVAGDNDEWSGLLGAIRSAPFPMPKVWPSFSDLRISELLTRAGAQHNGIPLEVRSMPSARNTEPYQGRPVCAGNSSCVPLCPIGAKYDATVHVKRAIDGGVELRTRAAVMHLVVGSDGRIAHVVYRDWTGHDHVVAGATVVLAAHAIESPRILLASQLPRGGTVGNTSDQVGRNLMDHLQKAAYGIAPEPLFPFRGPPSTSGIDTTRDGAFRSRRGAFRISLNNDGWGRLGAPYAEVSNAVTNGSLFGRALREAVAGRVQRQLRLSCSTEMLPSAANRLTLSNNQDDLGIRKVHLNFAADQYVKDAMIAATEAMQTILDVVGATETRVDRDFDTYSGAGHIMGTTRMGHDRRTSVVDEDCRAHDHENLFVVGASVFPSCGTANPTLTVAALALRAAPVIEATALARRGTRI